MGFHRPQLEIIDTQPIASAESPQSIDSDAHTPSPSSGTGLLSHMSTLGFLPSLASFFSDIAGLEGAIDHRCIATIRSGQGSHISSLAVVGDYLYAGTDPSSGSVGACTNSIRVWQKINLKECAGFGAGYAAVRALIVADNRILSAHQDHKIRVWSKEQALGAKRLRPKQVSEGDSHVRQEALHALDADDSSHKLLASMPTVRDYIKSFIPPRNYVQVRRHYKRLWIEHIDTISVLAVGGTVADPILYSASWDRTIKVWKLSDFKCVESFKAHDDAINALLVAPDGLLYTASADAKLKVWGTLGGSNEGGGVGIGGGGGGQQQQQQKQKRKHFLVATLEAHKAAVNALSLIKGSDEKGYTLYSGGCDRSIVVWEREDGTQQMMAQGVLRGHRNAILCLTSAGSLLCSGSADRTIRVWRRSAVLPGGGGTAAHSCVALLQGHGGPVKCLSLSLNGEGDCLLYSSSLDHHIKLWQLSGCMGDAQVQEDEDNIKKADEGNGKRVSLVAPWRFSSV